MNEKKITIQRAKGRPMLTWVGKKPLIHVSSYPAQLVETFLPEVPSYYLEENNNCGDWPLSFIRGGLFFHGDNKDILAYLLVNGFRKKINLIYIDPPFNTGVDYVRKINLRGIRTEKLDGEYYSYAEQVQYSASWSDDIFLQFLFDRMIIAKELLADNGVIFIRMDVQNSGYLKLLSDEVFGKDNYQNTIIVNRIKKNITLKGRRTIPNAVDVLLVYFKSNAAEYHIVNKMLTETRSGYWHGMESQGVPGPREIILENKKYFPAPGTHFKFTQKQTDEMYSQGRIRINTKNHRPEYWVNEKDFVNLDSNWTDIPGYSFTTGYPTENSEKLLERVINVASEKNDLILDFFLGSGSTVAIAQKLGRRWIGCDINKGSILTSVKRLQGIITEQIKEIRKTEKSLPNLDSVEKNIPAQLGFSIYRVNDYDLQIQHNEAVNLACEHIGITRSHTDSFFDGTLGKKLVRIIPFNHPLTPLDLEEVKRELDSRKGEDRDIVLVCLGKELAATAWLEEWNKLRSKTSVPNKIEVIELRTDEKYGGFMMHEPDQADVEIKRTGNEIKVKINNFISPTIIKRLKNQSGVLTPHIDDWRCMVDSVMIDSNYDNKVFNIVLADVPEKKDDLVNGEYAFHADKNSQVIAVKITDMLGEEILITKSV